MLGSSGMRSVDSMDSSGGALSNNSAPGKGISNPSGSRIHFDETGKIVISNKDVNLNESAMAASGEGFLQPNPRLNQTKPGAGSSSGNSMNSMDSAGGVLSSNSAPGKGIANSSGSKIQLDETGKIEIPKQDVKLDEIRITAGGEDFPQPNPEFHRTKLESELSGGKMDTVEGAGNTVGNFAGKINAENIPNMSKQEILDSLPKNWKYADNNGFVHIRDANGNVRMKIDPPDKVTKYDHVHLFDESGNPIDVNLNVVDRKSPDAHIPYKK